MGRLLLLVGLLLAGAAAAQEGPPPGLPDVAACLAATDSAHSFIPYYFYMDEPDSLLDMINAWERQCGTVEPVRRVRILAAIWDGAFTEGLYDEGIVDELYWRYDKRRLEQPAGDELPDLGPNGLASPGDVASPADFAAGRDEFDAFTTDLADQLLPHAWQGTPQEFFCLYEMGLVDQAYDLLGGGQLDNTLLYQYFQGPIAEEYAPAAWSDAFLGVSGSLWRPMGDLCWMGHKFTTGLAGGWEKSGWLIRGDAALRLGRMANPYHVTTADHEDWSDRGGFVALEVEGGPRLMTRGRTRWFALAGAGYEFLQPFKDQDELFLSVPHFHAGLAVHVDLSRAHGLFAAVDGYRAWSWDPTEADVPMGGDSWTVRLSLARFFRSDP